MSQVVVGVDPGTSCGWAVLDEDGRRLGSGTWDLSARRHEGGGMRFVRVRHHLEELLDAWPDQRIAYEEVRRHLGTDAAHVYGGIVAVVGSHAEEWRLPYVGVPVGTLKKLATGRGNASKRDMVDAANERWKPHVVVEDDEADALFVALAAVRRLA